MPNPLPEDERYFALIHDALDVCRRYRPKLGRGSRAGLTLQEFQAVYQEDPFYTWFGLDSPLLYTAHKAAGGMTSVYRQIGMACERLFRQILRDTLGLTAEQATWSYQVPGPGGKQRTLSLDGRIPIEDVADAEKAATARAWLAEAARSVNVEEGLAGRLRGPVFEVRQGYKSKDSKRQNADIANAANAYANSYLPVVTLFSVQIDSDVAERYARAQWIILRGSVTGTHLNSTYVFSKDVLGYDLRAFFERNTARIKAEVESVLEALLT